MSTDTYNRQKELICGECGRTSIVYSTWLMAICKQCHAGVTSPKLRRCSRCGFHKPAWQSSSYYCPPCHAQYQRERRQRRKAEGRLQWSVKTCSQCGVTEDMPPEGSWCRDCRNAYQRRWKREHGKPRELPPARTVPGREDDRKCSKCKRRRPYTRKEGWQGGVCGKCYQGYQRKSDANEKAKYRLWRETAAMVECRTCGQTKQYGVGWDGRLCRECQAIRAKAQYAEIKNDTARLKARKEKQEAARQRRMAQSADSSPSATPKDDVDSETPQTPEIAVVVASETQNESAEADARHRQAVRARKKLEKKGIQPLTGKVVVKR